MNLTELHRKYCTQEKCISYLERKDGARSPIATITIIFIIHTIKGIGVG